MFTVVQCERKYGDLLRIIRTRIHEYPELSMEEYQTTTLVREYLDHINLNNIELGLKSGAVALLNGTKPGKAIALRADIDALPIDECVDNPICSTIKGKMHACGHDVHTSILLGAAMLLSEVRSEMCGNILFIFQPGEETIQGAQSIIDTSLFKKCDIDCAP